MTVVAVLHPGEMGAAVGAALVEMGLDVVWLPRGRSPDTRARDAAAGMRVVEDLDGVDLVLSVCPPGAAVDVANIVAQQRFSGTYVDANAVSPDTAHEVASVVTAAGAAYVDGGSTRLDAAERSAATQGWRWEGEMQEVARTFSDAGLPAGFGEATAAMFGRYERPAPHPGAGPAGGGVGPR